MTNAGRPADVIGCGKNLQQMAKMSTLNAPGELKPSTLSQPLATAFNAKAKSAVAFATSVDAGFDKAGAALVTAGNDFLNYDHKGAAEISAQLPDPPKSAMPQTPQPAMPPGPSPAVPPAPPVNGGH